LRIWVEHSYKQVKHALQQLANRFNLFASSQLVSKSAFQQEKAEMLIGRNADGSLEKVQPLRERL